MTSLMNVPIRTVLISVGAADDRWASTSCSSDREVISEALGLDSAVD